MGHEQDPKEETCRICLESSPDWASKLSEPNSGLPEDDSLIAPCACSGTQAFVHFKCLRKWQTSVISSRRLGASLGPALVCSVCTQRFSIPPPSPAFGLRIWKTFTGYSCEVTAVFVVLSACYMALAGHTLQSLFAELDNGIALAREVIPCSFHLNVWEEKCLAPSCSLLKRSFDFGRSNLHPGTLLVATPAMPSPFFFGSVVLLYEHQRCTGSRGLILNLQAEEEKIVEWENQVFSRVQARALLRHISHGIGGPVAHHEWMIVHRCICYAALLANCNKRACSKGLGQEVLPGVYIGRDALPILRNSRGETPNITHQVLHGHAEWFVGQLGSEVRRGLWLVKENASKLLLSIPPHELWHVLLNK